MRPEHAALLAQVDSLALALDALRKQVLAIAAASDAVEASIDPLVDHRELNVPPTTFRCACRKGEIDGARIVGRKYLAPRSSVLAWLRGQASPADAAPPQHAELVELLDRSRVRRAS